MKALITGASSGMGREMAKYLFSKGYSLILVARREENLVQLKKSLVGKPEVKIITTDLSVPENAKKLYEETANENIDFLINNAGFGIYGEFANIDLDRDYTLPDLEKLEDLVYNIMMTHMDENGDYTELAEKYEKIIDVIVKIENEM